MTTVDDLVKLIGELYVRNRMLEGALMAQQGAPAEEQEENDETTGQVATPSD